MDTRGQGGKGNMTKQIGLIALILGVGLGTTLYAGATSSSAPFDFQFYDSCNDEIVDVSGTFHIVIITSDGKTEVRLNARGKGVGVDTGTEYVWNDTIHQSIDDPDGLEFSAMTVRKLRLISKGKAQNLVMDSEVTFEVDENGNLTISDVTVTNCRGAED